MRKKFLILITSIICTTNLFAQNEVGGASYYHNRLQGRKTASGEPYNKDLNTCAHPSLPFGTMLSVRNQRNGKEVIVKVNDRGPFHSKRIIDLSYSAAQAIDMVRHGIITVQVKVLPKYYDRPEPVLSQLEYDTSYLEEFFTSLPQQIPYLAIQKANIKHKKKKRRG